MIERSIRYQKYYWSELQLGDSHFRFGGDFAKIMEAWRAWKRSHAEASEWLVRFQRTRSGVKYTRIR